MPTSSTRRPCAPAGETVSVAHPTLLGSHVRGQGWWRIVFWAGSTWAREIKGCSLILTGVALHNDRPGIGRATCFPGMRSSLPALLRVLEISVTHCRRIRNSLAVLWQAHAGHTMALRRIPSTVHAMPHRVLIANHLCMTLWPFPGAHASSL
jgi:hypothetical protein